MTNLVTVFDRGKVLKLLGDLIASFQRLCRKSFTRNHDRQLVYQHQEERCLLASINFDSAAGVIWIGGTDGADHVVVSQSGDSLTVRRTSADAQTFAAGDVSRIQFLGRAGDDYFENQTAITSFAYGHAGNDELIGGRGDDRLIGNSGNDIVSGNEGNDYLVGGRGDDVVSGGLGDDRLLGVRGANLLRGDAGADVIFGGQDNDTIDGGAGPNRLVGGDGNDVINGGDDIDQIFAGFGNDRVQGNAGNDRIFGQAGNDVLSGGLGADLLVGNDGNDTISGAFGNDRINGSRGTDRTFHSGSLNQYRIQRLGANFQVIDLRGVSFGGTDIETSIELFQFADTVRTPTTIFDPARPTPIVPSTPTPPGPSVPGSPETPTPPTTVTPPESNIREIVTVQPIIVANSDGSNRAEFFGNAQQEADIKARIDEIFAQAQVDIEWLPARIWNNTFVNVGNSNNRPGSDLNRIVASGDSAGLGSTDRNVIDMYFVERVPGFGDVSEFTANGLAFVGAAGIAMQTGDRLVGFGSGRETVASVAAHEIGHNLGLPHHPDPDNLLASGGNSEDELTQAQINTILASPISRPV